MNNKNEFETALDEYVYGSKKQQKIESTIVWSVVIAFPLILFLLLILSGCAPITANAAPERPPADIYLPQVEDDLPALPIEDFLLQEGVQCWPVEFNRCMVFVDRGFLETLKGIPSPVAYEGKIYRKISWHPYPLEPYIWTKDADGNLTSEGEGIWVVTNNFRLGAIHYRR